MHFKSPSLGSNTSLVVKLYNPSSNPKINTTTTINASFRGPSALNSPKPSMTGSPKGSFRDCISAKKDKKKLVFADFFPKSTKNSQNSNNSLTRPLQEESPFRFFANESFSTTSGTLSPTTPHLGSYRMYITGRSKTGERPGLKIIASETQNRLSSGPRHALSPKDSEINHESGRLEMIKHKEKEVRKVKEEAEKELQKKELMVQIYEKLVDMCKKGDNITSHKRNKTNNANNASVRDNSILNETLKSHGNLDVILENGSFSRIKPGSGRKQASVNSSSLYNMLSHKSLQSPNKSSFFEKLDARLDLDREDVNGNRDNSKDNREEAGRQSITIFRQNISKLKQGSQSPHSPQYRVKTVVPGSRMKKAEKKAYEKSSAARSEPVNDSTTFHSVGKGTRILRMGESATLYTGSGCSEDQNLLSNQTLTGNSKLVLLKENSFAGIADRLDSVFAKYQNENSQLIAKIQELEQKIQAIQETKQRRAECLECK